MNAPQRRALSIAQKSQNNFKMGAVLAKKDLILGQAYNVSKSHPKGSGYWDSSHCELRAVHNYLRLNESQAQSDMCMYVARVSKLGYLGLARPCYDCLTFLKGIGLKKICYTASSGNWTTEKI